MGGDHRLKNRDPDLRPLFDDPVEHPPLEQPLRQRQPQPRLASALVGRLDGHRQFPRPQAGDAPLITAAAAVQRDDPLPHLFAQHPRRMVVLRPAQHQPLRPDIGGIDKEKMDVCHG